MINKKKVYAVLCIIFVVVFIILWSKSTKDIYANLQKIKEISNTEIKGTLVEAIFQNVREKMKHIDFSDLEQTGFYRERVFQSIDTTFLHQNKTLDAVTILFHNMQVLALQLDSLHGKGVRNHFDRLLIEKQVNAKTAVKVISTGHLKNLTTYSGDTTSMVIDERAEYIMNNKYGKIKYIVYVDYTLNALWQAFFRHALFNIIVLAVFLGGIIILLLKFRTSRKGNSNNVVTMRENFIQSKTEISLSNEKLKIEGNQIVFNGKSLRISPQSLQILQLFLDSEQYIVDKKELKEIWIYNSDSLSGMTSAINRLNHYLAQIGSSYVIVTDKLDKGYYKLDIKENR